MAVEVEVLFFGGRNGSLDGLLGQSFGHLGAVAVRRVVLVRQRYPHFGLPLQRGARVAHALQQLDVWSVGKSLFGELDTPSGAPTLGHRSIHVQHELHIRCVHVFVHRVFLAFARLDHVLHRQQTGHLTGLLVVQRRGSTDVVLVVDACAPNVHTNRTTRPPLVVLATVAVGVDVDCLLGTWLRLWVEWFGVAHLLD